MRKRTGVALAILAVAMIGWFAWEVLRPHEPEYRGKRLSEWLDEYNRAGSFDKTQSASEAMRAMGTNCWPFLLANIKHGNSPLKQKFLNLLGRQHWVRLP